jgi:uncharacterized protein (TIGR03437 family)
MPSLPTRLGLALLLPVALWCQTVRFHTTQGDIDVNLLPNVAPKTVANFLNYVNRGAYVNSLFHRSAPGFVIQGGGYQLVNHSPVAIPQDAPVVNEFNVSNTRGTLAMAKLGTDPNSATNQWFFNESDSNAPNLDSQNGGFTVFGRIANAAGLAVMDKIAALPVYDASGGDPSSAFGSLPLANYTGGSLQDSNFVLVTSITVLTATPVISAGGVISASAFGAFTAAAPGSYIEIYGTNLAGTTRQWAGSDFTNGAAPTALDGVTVTVNGQNAYVYAVSPTQVNAQVPANVPTTGQVQVVVTYQSQPSAPVMLNMQPTAAGLLAPATFLVNGKQYVYAAHADGTIVSNGSIAGLPSAPAAPGETLVFYGLGFGPVNETAVPIAGQIATGQTTLSASTKFTFGPSAGQVVYAGLAPGYVGLYQFNVTIPANAPSGDVPLVVTVGGSVDPQTLYVPVR